MWRGGLLLVVMMAASCKRSGHCVEVTECTGALADQTVLDARCEAAFGAGFAHGVACPGWSADELGCQDLSAFSVGAAVSCDGVDVAPFCCPDPAKVL